ncbi:DNA-binding protein [Alicyclobacillus cellulosilyticus]|uniref:DNA-binding protein n=1 Tax=Alicyclobacillus cellulosilyticus TaxID=1003997 RepID=A0A917KHJ2_9BACL|nr:metal-dependent transcriptional regulator [Alicyclobacillus cellulosilyticus]GGJ13900.1 DNA-binding protein [Alicyclobacillus cellulosilyticus]
MPATQGMERYLEAIYILDTEGEVVSPSRVADYLGVSRPTVTQTVQRMVQSGYVTQTENREIRLTDKGREQAEAAIRRHRLLERWLTDVLGLDWADAHVEATRLEHAVSPLVEERLFAKLGYPTTCPHGNVIPGEGRQQPAGMPLVRVEPSAVVRVVRILELAEEDLDLLRFLHRTGIVPEARLTVLPHQSPYEAGVLIEVGGERIPLDEQVAKRILVRPEPEAPGTE